MWGRKLVHLSCPFCIWFETILQWNSRMLESRDGWSSSTLLLLRHSSSKTKAISFSSKKTSRCWDHLSKFLVDRLLSHSTQLVRRIHRLQPLWNLSLALHLQSATSQHASTLTTTMPSNQRWTIHSEMLVRGLLLMLLQLQALLLPSLSQVDGKEPWFHSVWSGSVLLEVSVSKTMEYLYSVTSNESLLDHGNGGLLSLVLVLVLIELWWLPNQPS